MPKERGFYLEDENGMMEKENNDEVLMIDFLRDQLSAEEAEELRRRLANEPKLRKRRDNLANTFAALDLAPTPEVPPDLAERTLAKIASCARLKGLLPKDFP